MTTSRETQVKPSTGAGAVSSPPLTIEEVVARACDKIAPTWPLDRFIAVNPFWKLVSGTTEEVAAKLQALSGASLLMPRAWYRQAYREGRLRDEHLQAALTERGPGPAGGESSLVPSPVPPSLATLRALLDQPEPPVVARAQVVDLADEGRDLAHELPWRTYVANNLGQFCAAFFDEGQAAFGPAREGGLYATWRRHARDDRSPALLMGAVGYPDLVAQLPATAGELVTMALAALDVAPSEQESYLWSLLLDQNGWASWCAYRAWEARLAGGDDGTLAELLAIRLAWEWLLFRLGGEARARTWAAAMARWPQVDRESAAARAHDWWLQAAMEVAWRSPLVAALPRGLKEARPSAPSAQVVFCIDVRSEVFRRALEAVAPGVQTLGFAGFFGVPLAYQPLAAETARPQLPGLLAPRLQVTDTRRGTAAEADEARALDLHDGWRAFQSDPLSIFTFVDAWGPSYALKLVKDGLGLSGGAPAETKLAPLALAAKNGEALALEARCDLAANMLRGMSLTRAHARLVLLVGHGSRTRNNPHAAGLDCGACGGQSGEVNARVAVALLNDPAVRAGLAARGIAVPSTTFFVAGLHDTTSDEVTLYDVEGVPGSHAAELEALRRSLAEAGARTRAERAARFGLEGIPARTKDWAQVRPEWGLVGNAGFIVAPREHCRHLDLAGRVFLHEYRHAEDPGYGVLELIMTAPMVVAHWINFQYYASTVDNRRYGSGNKVLHNVVGGHLGVFEGNGGHLRIGLPMQSLHDGSRWVHTPLRLSVFIEAPRAALQGIIDKHATVRDLVTNGWVSLFQLDEVEGAVYAFRGGEWHLQRAVASSSSSVRAPSSSSTLEAVP